MRDPWWSRAVDDADLDYREPDSVGETGLTYWAKKDPEQLFPDLKTRFSKFFRQWRDSPFYQEIARNWLYYYGQFGQEYNLFGGAIERRGPQGEFAFMVINHMRSLLHHLYVLATKDRPEPIAKAAANTSDSALASKIGNAFIENLMKTKRLEKRFTRAAEEGLILTSAFCIPEWDDWAGKIVGVKMGEVGEDGQPTQKGFEYEGDGACWNAAVFDVAFDWRQTQFDDHNWLIVRRLMNKWDLAEVYPQKRDKLVSAKDDERGVDRWDVFSQYNRDEDSDLISCYYFIHKRTPAMPMGLRMLFTDTCWLERDVLPEWMHGLNVFRVAPADAMLTPFGYSPGFDLQGPQECLNMMTSNITSTHDAHGVQNLWSPPGNALSAAQFQGGLRIITSKIEPKALNLASTAPDAYKFIELVIKSMEYLSGINSVVRGQPEKSLQSGRALSIIESKAYQYAAGFVQSYYQMIEDVMTTFVRMYETKLVEGKERPIEIVGQFGAASLTTQFGQGQLKQIERVVVESGNPLQRTVSGRLDLARMFQEMGWLQSPEQALEVLQTGRIEPLLQAATAQVQLVHNENDGLLAGQVQPINKGDYHQLHIREQLALVSLPQVRQDQKRASDILAHVAVHIAMLYLPDVIDLQIKAGWPVPQNPALAPPAGVLGMIQQSPYAGNFNQQDMDLFMAMSGAPPASGGAASPPGGQQPPQGPGPTPPRQTTMSEAGPMSQKQGPTNGR